MDDAGGRGHHAEGVEGPLAPLEEPVALQVASELPLAVDLEGERGGVGVHLHRVVDDQVGRDQGVTREAAAGSPVRRTRAARIAARSATAGTPVKSCSTTRPGRKAISAAGTAAAS